MYNPRSLPVLIALALLVAVLIPGCAPPAPAELAASAPTVAPTGPATVTRASTPSPAPSLTPTASPTLTPTHTLRPAATATDGPSPTPSPTITLTPTPTTPPLLDYTLDALAARQYGEGDLHVQQELPSDKPYHQYVIEHFSDGIQVTGLAYVPFGDGPFPVILVLHGYTPPADYFRGFDAALLAETYALNGYAAIMPDYRGYMNTAGGPNPMRIPYAIDVLNLIGVLDMLDVLDEERVGVIGHSMGGGVATYIMVLAEEVDAVVLYGSLSADQAVNFDYVDEVWSHYWMLYTASIYGSPETHPNLYAAISPVNYLDRVNMPVQIHHGDADAVVPVEWSRDLAGRLQQAGVDVTYYEYPGAPHTFRGQELDLLRARTLSFFDEHVKRTGAGVSTVVRSPHPPHSSTAGLGTR